MNQGYELPSLIGHKITVTCPFFTTRWQSLPRTAAVSHNCINAQLKVNVPIYPSFYADLGELDTNLRTIY